MKMVPMLGAVMVSSMLTLVPVAGYLFGAM
jgi:hypothetical protein